MKQILYVVFALFFSVMIFSCGGDKNYEIKGMIANPSLDGEYVYLQKIENDALQTVDSALVKDQRFKFTGIADSAVIREISFGNKGTGPAPVVFVLQQGHMEAYVDTFSTMTGTVDNDKLTEFQTQRNYLVSKIQKIMSEYQMEALKGPISDSITMVYQGQYEVAANEITNLSYNFALLNNTNVAGALVFLQSISSFTYQQVESILSDAGQTFLNVEGIEMIKKQVDLEKNVAVGKPFVEAIIPDTTGIKVSLSDYIGKGDWVLVDFWASWCTPCVKEFPYLKEAYNKYKDKGFKIIGISLDANREAWISAIKKNNLNWIQLSNLKGWDCPVAKDYAIQSIPMTILFNPQGFIQAKGLRQDMLLIEIQNAYDKK